MNRYGLNCQIKAAPHNGARRFGQCFDTSESMENAGILDVFPIFHTARLGQKIRRNPQSPLRVAAFTIVLTKNLSTESPYVVLDKPDGNIPGCRNFQCRASADESSPNLLFSIMWCCPRENQPFLGEQLFSILAVLGGDFAPVLSAAWVGICIMYEYSVNSVNIT